MSELMFVTDNIRATIKEMQGEKRFNHTLGVEEEAFELGKIFMPDKCEKLALCGLLHDITKKLKTDEQLALCDEYGIEVDRKTIYSDVAAINRFIPIEVTYGPNGGYQWVDVLRGAECE
jgi:HD superfamily phosphohydrolase YqeK